MRIFIISISLFFVAIIQSTVFSFLQVFGVKPNLILVMILSVALASGRFYGGVAGFIGGMLMDSITGSIFGVHTLLCMYLGVWIGGYGKRFFRDSYFVVWLFSIVFCLIYQIVYYILKFALMGNTQILYVLQYIILPETAYTAVFFLPIYAVVLKANAKLISSE